MRTSEKSHFPADIRGPHPWNGNGHKPMNAMMQNMKSRLSRAATDVQCATMAAPAGFIGPSEGRVVVYRDDGKPKSINPGDPVFVGDVLEADTTSAVNVTVIGMTTLSVGGNGRMVVTQARETE